MNNEEKILSLLETMNHRMDVMNGSIGTMDNRIEQMASDIKIVNADVVGLKSDMSIVKNDVSGLKIDVFDLKDDLYFVRGSVVRIELEHGGKLDALFDGYQQLNGKTDRIEAHVSQQDDYILKRIFPSVK